VDQGRGLRLLDPPDVDVELAALDHAERLFMGGIHVFQVLIELRLWKRDRTLGSSFLEDMGAGAGASPAASPAALLGRNTTGVPDAKRDHSYNRGNCYSLSAHCSS
jgi:hypothetical protein